MPTPTPTPSPTVLLNFPLLHALGPTLAIVLQIVTLLGALYGFILGVGNFIGWLSPPRLKLYMSDNLWPVGEQNESQFAINIQFVAYNPGKRLAALRRLEGSLTRPAFGAQYPVKTFPLVWHFFIKGNPAGFEQTEPVFVKAVAPHDWAVVAVQLRGNYDPADSFHPGHFDWFPGQYALHLHGRINRRRMRLSPQSGFTFLVTEFVSGELSPVGPIAAPLTHPLTLAN
jgi:hypothetical protein